MLCCLDSDINKLGLCLFIYFKAWGFTSKVNKCVISLLFDRGWIVIWLAVLLYRIFS